MPPFHKLDTCAVPAIPARRVARLLETAARLTGARDPAANRSGKSRGPNQGSFFGAQYRQIACRHGPNKASVAVAHSLIELVWHLLNTGEVFTDLGDDYVTNRQDPERRARHLVAQLEELGYAVTLEAALAIAA